MLYDETLAPDTGEFDSNEVRRGGPPDQVYARNFAFNPGQYTFPSDPPQVACGFRCIDCNTRPGDNIRIRSIMQPLETKAFKVSLETWNVSTADRLVANWVEHKTSAKTVASGSFGKDLFNWSGSQSARINFGKTFSQAPYVVVWFTKLDLRTAERWQVQAFANNVDQEGFTCHIESIPGKSVYNVVVDWITVPNPCYTAWASRLGTEAASQFNTQQFERSGYHKYPAGIFKTPPSVLGGINMIDQSSQGPLRINLEIRNVTKDGFEWALDHDSPFANSATAISVSND